MFQHTMKAARIYEHGDPSVIRYEDVPLPEVGPEDVLVRVHMTALCGWDLRYRAGNLPPRPVPGRPHWPLPFQLGRDAAGEVAEIGGSVTKWKVGDRVVQMPHPACGQCRMCQHGKDNLCLNTSLPGMQSFGGQAEYIVCSQSALLALPDNVTYEAAGAALWAYTTPLNCARQAAVKLGDTVLITGASGSIAIACMQLAKLHGARTIGTTTKLNRAEEIKAIGYDYIIDSNDPEAARRVKEITKGIGASAVWDCVGGTKFLTLAIACIQLGGTIATLATPTHERDGDITLKGLSFITGQIGIVGVRGATRTDQSLCIHLLETQQIKPIVDRIFPLSAIADAHRYMESGNKIGRVLLAP